MSRTIKGSKGPGHEYWKSRLHRGGEVPGHRTKVLTHRKERRDAKRTVRLAWVSVVVAVALWVGGCAAPKAKQEMWHPATKHEMKMLIGQTTIEAIDQYIRATRSVPPSNKPRKCLPLKPEDKIDPDPRS